MEKPDTFRQVLDLLQRLREAKISHRLNQSRDDAITIEVDVPGERWEIDLADDGDEVHVEIERFRSNGTMHDESALTELFNHYSDQGTWQELIYPKYSSRSERVIFYP